MGIEWIIFAAGFAAGAFCSLRDLPLAAIVLGIVLVIAAHRLGAFNP